MYEVGYHEGKRLKPVCFMQMFLRQLYLQSTTKDAFQQQLFTVNMLPLTYYTYQIRFIMNSPFELAKRTQEVVMAIIVFLGFVDDLNSFKLQKILQLKQLIKELKTNQRMSLMLDLCLLSARSHYSLVLTHANRINEEFLGRNDRTITLFFQNKYFDRQIDFVRTINPHPTCLVGSLACIN